MYVSRCYQPWLNVIPVLIDPWQYCHCQFPKQNVTKGESCRVPIAAGGNRLNLHICANVLLIRAVPYMLLSSASSRMWRPFFYVWNIKDQPGHLHSSKNGCKSQQCHSGLESRAWMCATEKSMEMSWWEWDPIETNGGRAGIIHHSITTCWLLFHLIQHWSKMRAKLENPGNDPEPQLP